MSSAELPHAPKVMAMRCELALPPPQWGHVPPGAQTKTRVSKPCFARRRCAVYDMVDVQKNKYRSTLADLCRARSAVISPCGKYRYHLGRRIGGGQRIVTFIMLNPSTADANIGIIRPMQHYAQFAEAWDCAELNVVNLFAIRSTRPEGIIRARAGDPENRKWIQRALESSALVVCACRGTRQHFIEARSNGAQVHQETVQPDVPGPDAGWPSEAPALRALFGGAGGVRSPEEKS